MCGRSGFSGCPGIPKLPSILTSKQPSLFGAPAVVRRANGRKTAKVSNAAGVVSDVMSIINTVHDTWNKCVPRRFMRLVRNADWLAASSPSLRRSRWRRAVRSAGVST